MRFHYPLLLVGCFLSGCAVGPEFHRPLEPVPDTFLPADVPAAPADQPLSSAEPPPDWWKAFGNAALDAAVAKALARNPALQSADAAARVAVELARAQRGVLFPSVQATASSTRERSPDVLAPPLASNATVFTLHTAQLGISYVFDVFGGNRRLLESSEAQAEAQRYQREAAALTLASNVVVAAVQEASLHDQIEATRELIGVAQQQLRLTRRQFELGAIPQLAVVAQEASLAQVEALVPPLEKQWEQQRHALSALVGDFPANASATFRLADFRLPDSLPVSLPSKLLDRRPDVRAAEAQVHAASAQVGVAIANRLPQVNITGAYGFEGTRLPGLFDASSLLWSLAAGVTQPLFQGGALRHRARAAEASLQQAALQYRSVALNAFQGVADALAAVEADARAVAAAQRAEAATRRTLEMTQKQLELGDVNYPALLSARQAYQQALVLRIQAQAARLADSAALFLAVAGALPREGPCGGAAEADCALATAR